MRDFEFTKKLQALLRRKDVEDWLLAETRGGAAPVANEAGQIVFRMDDDSEAERFEAKWLKTQSPAG